MSTESVSVSGGFCLLVLWFVFVNGWHSAALILSAALLHELGHWIVLRMAGGKLLSLRVSVFGAEMEIADGLSYGREAAVVLAGPLVNLTLGLLAAAHGGALLAAAGAHLISGTVNLLPLRPLDGGRLLYLIAARMLDPPAGERAVRCVSACTAAAGAAFLLWLMGRSGGSLWLCPAAVGAALTAGKELSEKNSFL